LSVLYLLRAVAPFALAASVGQSLWVTPVWAQSGSGNGNAVELKPDDVIQAPGTSAVIDVLANDTVPAGAPDQPLEIIAQPQCGIVTPGKGELTYQTTSTCLGPQIFYYGIAGSPAFAQVTVMVQAQPVPELSIGMALIEPQDRTAPRIQTAPATDGGPKFVAAAAPRAKAAEAEVPAATVLAAVPATEAVTAPTRKAANGACTTAPTASAAEQPGALTWLTVSAPCVAGSAAELTYGDLRLGIAIDSSGRGELLVPGFAAAMPAVLSFTDGTKLEFDLAFSGLSQIGRFAVASDAAASFMLSALEFGATPGAAGHLSPENPRSFDDVRRSGGGYLASYAPVDGVGQTVQVYTHLAKQGGRSGVVRMLLDHDGLLGKASGICGAAAQAQSEFLILQSDRGLVERQTLGGAGSADCIRSGLNDRPLGEPVGNVVIR
jgi:hypothetical protein